MSELMSVAPNAKKSTVEVSKAETPSKSSSPYTTTTKSSIKLSGPKKKSPSDKSPISIKAPLSSSLSKLSVTTDDGPAHRRPFALVGTGTQEGYMESNPGKVNQDRFIRIADFNGDSGQALFGVFDGHGMFGHKVAAFVANTLPTHIMRLQQADFNAVQLLTDAFEQTSDDLLHNSGINSAFSGTTAVASLMTMDCFYTANAGDSRAVLGRETSDGVEAINLSQDHKPERPDERNRILAHGGRVRACKGFNGSFVGPERVWLAHEDVPGLAMTRSFGDGVAASVGVISKPDVSVVKRTPEDRFVVWASDGVWEFLSSQQVVDIVSKCSSPRQACLSLIRESTRRWKLEEDVIDDITAVVAFL